MRAFSSSLAVVLAFLLFGRWPPRRCLLLLLLLLNVYQICVPRLEVKFNASKCSSDVYYEHTCICPMPMSRYFSREQPTSISATRCDREESFLFNFVFVNYLLLLFATSIRFCFLSSSSIWYIHSVRYGSVVVSAAWAVSIRCNPFVVWLPFYGLKGAHCACS